MERSRGSVTHSSEGIIRTENKLGPTFTARAWAVHEAVPRALAEFPGSRSEQVQVDRGKFFPSQFGSHVVDVTTRACVMLLHLFSSLYSPHRLLICTSSYCRRRTLHCCCRMQKSAIAGQSLRSVALDEPSCKFVTVGAHYRNLLTRLHGSALRP